MLLPVYVAGFSGLTFFLQAVADAFTKNGLSEAVSGSADSHTPGRPRFRRILENLGGGTIFAYKLVQLLAVLGLLGISMSQLVLQNAASVSHNLLGTAQTVQVAQCALYVSRYESMSSWRG